jgi:hypothetical protein
LLLLSLCHSWLNVSHPTTTSDFIIGRSRCHESLVEVESVS